MSQVVHEAYLMALSDERSILRQAVADGEDIGKLARDMLESCNATMARGWSGDMADYVRGSRDFWANQVRKWGK